MRLMQPLAVLKVSLSNTVLPRLSVFFVTRLSAHVTVMESNPRPSEYWIKCTCNSYGLLMSQICKSASAVVIGFQRTSYTVSEGAGSVQVCAEILAGQLRAPDMVTFLMRTQQSSK